MAGPHYSVRTAPKLRLNLLQHFKRSSRFEIYTGILLYTEIQQWVRVGIILVTF